jgi:hypothetical protein
MYILHSWSSAYIWVLKEFFFIKRNYKGLKDRIKFMSTRWVLNVGNSDSKGYFQ